MNKLLTGEWFIDRSSAHRRRVIHYWATILWLTVGLVAWAILRNALWFVGFMSLYAIWSTHIAGCAAENPCRSRDTRRSGRRGRGSGGGSRAGARRKPASSPAV
jgi:hypothetical protein